MINIKKLLGNTLLKQSTLYTIFNIINAAIPFLLIPFLTRKLTPEEYGVITIYTTIINFLIPFISLNIPGSITNKFYSTEKIDTPSFLGNAIIILSINMIFSLFVIISFSNKISAFTQFPSKWLWTIIVVSFSMSINQIRLIVWQIKGDVFKFGFFQIFIALFGLGLTILLILKFGLSWKGRIIAHTLVTSLAAIFAILIFYLEKGINFKVNLKYISNALKFGIPLIPHSFGAILISMTDKVLIARTLGLNSTGIYGLGFQMGSTLGIFTSAFNLAFVPWLFENLSKNKLANKYLIVKFTYYYFIILFLFFLLLTILLPLLNNFLLGEKFVGSINITICILLGFVFNGMYLMVTNYIFYVEKTYFLGITTLSIGIINIFLCQFLLKKMGIMGAAISTTISYFFCFIITWYLSNRVFPMPWFELRLKKTI